MIEYKGVQAREAIAFLRAKNNVTTESWNEIMRDAHARAFTVAGATKLDLLADIRAAVDTALANNAGIAAFRKEFDSIVAKHGWAYKGKRGWRTRLIYSVNLSTAHMAGKWAAIQRNKKRRPYLRYRTAGDNRVRPAHRTWDDVILPVDHPFWNTHYPPNGWLCRCNIQTLSQRQLERMDRTISRDPVIKKTERVNPQTGEVYGKVPQGIDTGWDYNVGTNWADWDNVSLSQKTPSGSSGTTNKLLSAVSKDDKHKTKYAEVPDQPTYKDLGLPDMREIIRNTDKPAPPIIKEADTLEDAIQIMRDQFNVPPGGSVVTKTVINEDVVIRDNKLEHLVYKRTDERERYVALLAHTLNNPDEVWLVKYSDGSYRSRYISFISGKDTSGKKNKDNYSGFVVVKRGKDGHLLWNFIPKDRKGINKERKGELIYRKDDTEGGDS